MIGNNTNAFIPVKKLSLLLGVFRPETRVTGDSARVRISAPGADITLKIGVYPHQVQM
jgi:hypothetical protein